MSKNLSWSANTLKPPKSIPTSVLRVQPLSFEFFGYSTLKFWDVFIEDFGSLATIPHGVAHQLSTSRSKLWIFSSNYWILYWKLRTGKEPVSFGELEIEQPFKGFEQPFFFFWSSAHIAKMCQRGPGDVGKIPTWYIPGVYSPLVSTLPVFYATENQWHGPTLGRSLSSHFILNMIT